MSSKQQCRWRGIGVFVALALAAASVQALAGEEHGAQVAPMRLAVPAQPIANAINELSRQSGLHIVIDSRTAAGITSTAVEGNLAPVEALRRLLENTGLGYEYLGENAIAIRTLKPSVRASAEASARLGGVERGNLKLVGVPAGSHAVQQVSDSDVAAAAESEKEKGRSKSAADGKESTEVTVTGSRIRSVLGKAGVNPVLTYTREDLDHMGVTTLGDFTRRITQNVQNSSLGGTGLATPDPFTTDARTTINLRGLGNNTTLVLVNGRRIAKTGQGTGDDDYDLGGIPLGAVERIEVLTDGASAIYGADAIGGVVNVILREQYTGVQADVSYGNTFDSDTAERNMTLSAGFSRGAFQAFISGSWADANSLARSDRYFSASDDKRPLGGLDRRRQGAGGTGRVFNPTGAPLPGLTSFQAGIPLNQDGRSLTIADFQATDGMVEAHDLGPLTDAISPFRRRSAMLNMEYTAADWLSVFVNSRYTEASTFSENDPPIAAYFRIPADYPYNPFGIDVRLDKYFWELGRVDVEETTIAPSVDAGLRGDIFGDWRYEASASWTTSKRRFDQRIPRSFLGLSGGVQDPDDPLVVLHDSFAGPANPAGRLESFLRPQGYGEIPETSTAALTADGSVYQLPAGRIAAAVGFERRIEKVEFDIVPTSSIPGSFRDDASRNVNALFAEVSVPILGGRWSWPMAQRLELLLSGRRDEYSDFGRSDIGRYGVLYRPVDWLMLRATYGEGFKTPTLVQLHQSVSTFIRNFTPNASFNFATDPLRNGEFVVGPILSTQGGNTGLRPERSESTNIGVVLEMPWEWARGVSLSVDYYDLLFFDRVGSVSPNEIVNFFPERVTRGPESGDGLPGPIVAVDFRAVNFAKIDTSGFDVRASWHRPTERGDFYFEAQGSKVRSYMQLSSPLDTPDDFIDQRPLRVVGSLFWSRQPYEIGWTSRYVGSFRTGGFFDEDVDSAIEHDLQLRWNTGRLNAGAGSAGWLGEVLSDTQWSLTIFNIFDAEPPFVGSSVVGFTSTDPRMRRYVFSVRKSF